MTKVEEMAHKFGSQLNGSTVILTVANAKDLWRENAEEVIKTLEKWGCSVRRCWVRRGFLKLKRVEEYQIRMTDPRYWY